MVTPGSAPNPQRFGIGGVAKVSLLPGMVGGPHERGLDRGAGHAGGLQQVEGHAKDRVLHRDIEGPATGVTKLEV